MDGARQLRPEFLSHAKGTSHVSIRVGAFKKPILLLQQNGGTEWLKQRALLYHTVDPLTHIRIARICKYASISQRPWSPFHRSVIDRSNFPFKQQGCDGFRPVGRSI